MSLQVLPDSEVAAPRATDEQIRKASALIKRIDLKDFSVCQFANPGMLLPILYKSHNNILGASYVYSSPFQLLSSCSCT